MLNPFFSIYDRAVRSAGRMRPSTAMNAARHKIINLLKTLRLSCYWKTYLIEFDVIFLFIYFFSKILFLNTLHCKCKLSNFINKFLFYFMYILCQDYKFLKLEAHEVVKYIISLIKLCTNICEFFLI